jgi:two-component system OmpR family sensor kinase
MQQFLANASHELKTPLTAIHGLAEVLSMGAAKDETQLAAGLQSILSESERLERLVRELLTLTKLDQQVDSPMKPVNLADILSEIRTGAEIMAGQKFLSFQIQDDLTIMANHDHIKQIMLNLIQNAFQHTAEQGKISVTLTACNGAKGTMAVLRVEDDGFGIPRESLDRIFNRFYRVDSHRSREQGGSGLGLAIVKSIVERYGGAIEVESEMGRGTAFNIEFPAINSTL